MRRSEMLGVSLGGKIKDPGPFQAKFLQLFGVQPTSVGSFPEQWSLTKSIPFSVVPFSSEIKLETHPGCSLLGV